MKTNALSFDPSIVGKKMYSLVWILLLLSAPGRIFARETVLTYRIGDCRVSILSEGGREAGSSLLTGGDAGSIGKYLPEGVFRLETQAFLLRMPEKNILVDAGEGKNLSENLESLGITSEQIHAVLLTHMHGDHIGGLLRNGEKAFPQAELYLSQAEYDYRMANERGENAQKVLEVYKDKLHLFVPGEVGEGTPDLLAGIRAVAAFGHTPGHTAYLVESLHAKLLIWGDVVHAAPVQIPHPEVSVTFDHNPSQAAATRKNILEYVRKNKIRIAGAHIVMPAMGDILQGKAGEAYEFKPFSVGDAL